MQEEYKLKKDYKNAEKQYESYEEADKVLSDDNLSEEKAMEVFGDCFGDEFKEMMESVEGELDYEMDYDDEMDYEGLRI